MIGALFSLVRPGLMALDAETAHAATIRALRLLPAAPGAQDAAELAVSCFGMTFPNPVGLAAGFDKHAEVYNRLGTFGFGFVEIGAVTPQPQPGNPRPRAFRLTSDEAIINRYGFNSEGVEAVRQRLAMEPPRGIVGINLGANKTTEDRAADYDVLVRRLAPLASFVTANVSSPNTPGLRTMQNRALFDDLLARVVAARDAACEGQRRTPVLVKIAPDVTDAEIDDIVAVALERGVDGMIVSNTTITRPETLKETVLARETGGLSGRPLFRLSTIALAKTAQRIERRMPLIGVGGIDSAEAALTKLAAGATLLQLYSALIYKGPGLVSTIKAGIAAEVRRKGVPLAGLTGTSMDDIATGRF